ncbi:DUF1107 family protein [Salmonella enterica subsp. enterica]|nr:DUF1107 family protein [Salmonella enterica subsp. enterica]
MAKVRESCSWTVIYQDVGAFEFDKGKVAYPEVRDKQHLSL